MKNNIFKDKVAVITGGASGIGAALAKAFAGQGSRIALLDADGDGLEDFSNSFKALGVDIFSAQCDVTDQARCEEVIGEIKDRWGQIDILINNAGITQRGSFLATDISVFKRVMDVNFYGSLYCTKAALPEIVKSKGSVVVMESIAGIAPLPGRTGYCSSKHALHGLFSTLRTEVRSLGVHIMMVCTGFIRTNLQTRALGTDGNIASSPRTTMGKDYTPEMVAEAVIQGILKQRRLLALTPAGKLGYYVYRFMPGFYERMVEKKFSREL